MRGLFCSGLLLTCLLLPAAARSDVGSKGTEVTWTNQDDIPHTIVLPAIGVRSKAIDTDKTYSYRFDKAGAFAYICDLHPQMHGQVVMR